MKTTIVAIAAVILCAASASAQTVTTSTTQQSKNRVVITEADGTVNTTTVRRSNGVTTYTHERVAPPRRLADILRDLPAAEAPKGNAHNGAWTGREGSPRDVAWMEACRPTTTTDRYGMTRYVYAKPGCESGDAR